MIVAISILQVLIMMGLPFALLVWLGRQWRPWPIPWGLAGAGALAWIGAEVVHFPLNSGLTWLVRHDLLPRPGHAWQGVYNAVILGLTAGLCEELARFVVLRFWRKRARSFREAVVLGAGHGGVEAIFFGGLAALGLLNVLIASSMDLGAAGLSPEELAAAQAQLAAFYGAPAWSPLLAAWERIPSVFFHLALSSLVMLAVVRRRAWPLAAAILLHATADATSIYLLPRAGAVLTELAITASMPISAAILWATARRLPAPAEDPDRPVARPLAPPGAPAASGAPVEVWHAGKVYPGGVRALDDASFSIAPGERACLLGPNGAGKTTMLRLLVGALAPTRGVVRLFGHTAGEPGFLAAKRRVGVVPQSPGMYRDVSVGEHLRLVQALYGRGDIPEVARALGLTDVLDRPMAQLSGGMQRRFAIAGALLPRPDLLLLDEPTVGLDPVAAHDVQQYLGTVMEGRTTLLCTHNLAEAEDLCDSVVIVRGGRVLVHEPIARLRARVAPEVLLRARQGPAALQAELARLGHAPRAEDDAVAVTLPEPEREVPALLRALLGAGLDVYETRIVKPTLEDLFLRIVAAPDAPAPQPDAGPPAPAPARSSDVLA